MELRVTLKLHISITDRIQESINRRLSSPSGGKGIIKKSDAWEMTKRYRRLLHVVLNNWWYTEWIIRALLAQRVSTTSEITLYDMGLEEEDEKYMIPLILGRLDKADADFFRRVCDERWLLVQDDPFWDCFEIELSSVPAIENTPE